MDQGDLEDWSGAQRGTPAPEKTNRYLFSVAGNPERLTARTVERGQIVLLASLSALCVGLLLIYLPAMRRPTTLLVGGVLLLALAAWNADLALLVAQASVLGLALIFLSGYLEHTVVRRRTGAVVVRSGSSILKRSGMHVPIRELEAASVARSRNARRHRSVWRRAGGELKHACPSCFGTRRPINRTCTLCDWQLRGNRFRGFAQCRPQLARSAAAGAGRPTRGMATR